LTGSFALDRTQGFPVDAIRYSVFEKLLVAGFSIFLVSEAQHFLGGNGRIAGVMMNTELVNHKQSKNPYFTKCMMPLM